MRINCVEMGENVNVNIHSQLSLSSGCELDLSTIYLFCAIYKCTHYYQVDLCDGSDMLS